MHEAPDGQRTLIDYATVRIPDSSDCNHAEHSCGQRRAPSPRSRTRRRGAVRSRQALENTGKGRVLSTPRVTTQNNVEAEIMQGVQIPVVTPGTTTNPPTVTYKDAALTLRVTPQITAANTVIMQISVENGSAGVAVLGNPSINTQRAITRVQVSDGTTTIMGGIFISTEQSIEDRTPGLYRLPLLGWLFKRTNDENESRELLIFITPRILKG